MFSTPILLITFNRPTHTRQVLQRIMEQQSQKLYVFQDGAREGNDADVQKCAEVRKVVEQLTAGTATQLFTNYSDKNLGCGAGPATAISWFFANEEMGIIIEDDAVPHADFFPYCAELLERYKDNPDVRAIGSMKLFDRKFGDGSYYFSMMNRTLCAWASWRRAWRFFDYKMEQFSCNDLASAMKRYGAKRREIEYWQERLDEIHADCLRGTSWDQQFWMTIWLSRGCGICPNSNLSTNIGFDEFGTHTQDSTNVGAHRALEPILPLIHPANCKIQRKADLLFDKIYFEPYNYGWAGFKRLPFRINKRVKRLLNHKGPWIKHF